MNSRSNPELIPAAVTYRQREAMWHLVSGRSTNAQIGAAMQVDGLVARNYLNMTFKKCGVRNRVELALKIVRTPWEAALREEFHHGE